MWMWKPSKIGRGLWGYTFKEVIERTRYTLLYTHKYVFKHRLHNWTHLHKRFHLACIWVSAKALGHFARVLVAQSQSISSLLFAISSLSSLHGGWCKRDSINIWKRTGERECARWVGGSERLRRGRRTNETEEKRKVEERNQKKECKWSLPIIGSNAHVYIQTHRHMHTCTHTHMYIHVHKHAPSLQKIYICVWKW